MLDRIERTKSLIGKNASLLFNALLKKHSIRLWGCSRRYSKIMKNSESNDSEDWECEEVSQYRATRAEDQTDDNLIGVIWSKKYGLRPDFVQTWKYILSTPMLLKAIWTGRGLA